MAISKSKLVNVARQKDTFTEKGMPTNSTSLNACVDMFFMAGATRHWTDKQIEELFQKALMEDPSSALKLMFWARDIRGGSGERRFFRVCLSYLEKFYPEYLNKNINLVPEYGRWDDILHLNKDIYMPLVKEGLEKENGLLGKWLPRKGLVANSVRKSLGLSPKEYRKMLVSLSKTVEQLMCAGEFDNIEYSHVPSVAMNKYRKAFYKRSPDRFTQYIDNVRTGISKMCAGAIYPYQLYDAFQKATKSIDIKAIEAQWYSLPNYMENSKERILPIVDTSDSMKWYGGLPSRVAWSLAVYISERNDSIFKDAFMTFSTHPRMIHLTGTVSERLRAIARAPWTGTTDLDAAFVLLLSKAIENNITDDQMPTTLLILSDMQFDPSRSTKYDNTALEMMRENYAKAGYKLPRIIFWNLRAERDNVTASVYDENVGLVSGYSPSTLMAILQGEEIQNEETKEEEVKKETPYDIMMKIVNSERYSAVTV